ncbi:MAG: radical SAM family heme chaperone HemW [Jaaginema sp. PMC 1079.18]|nr:radical SAM family heme chaperone HemW [Jaaginema sp. PMC 1080.18]MEC4854122.1 radical SAM family heme chaperone HemW [Jaaginema sp. PMC 1079.18]MEC4865844.1 radical SAM family heme chaperone HemW [Jaaginema sp. PMC 1078.18]
MINNQQPTTNNQQLKKPQAAYLHIPFCRRRCYYCDFAVSVVGDKARGETSGSIAEYVEVLEREIQQGQGFDLPLTTVFFGGGTPSLLSVGQLERILRALEGRFGIANDAEISMEIDPGTFDLEQIQGYQKAGVNRFSLGVQSFDNKILQACGRSHSRRDIFAAVEILRQAGVTNFSLDLISGLPHQTLSQWQNTLNQAIAIAPQHLSCYDLVLEPVTAFGKQYQPGEKPLPNDEDTAEMYRLAQQILTQAGFLHYEISNYAQPGFQCRHNQVYWQNQPYYGLGMGAASYFNRQRWTRSRTRREYYQWVAQGCPITTPPQNELELLLETLMLKLRLATGIKLTELAHQFGEDTVTQLQTCLQPERETGLVVFRNNSLHFSDPEGFLWSNTILSQLFAHFSSP